MKFFISQAMYGRNDDDIIAERERCEKKIRKEYPGAEILQSYFRDFVEDERWTPTQKRIKYLAKSIEMEADADVVVIIQICGKEVPAGVLVESKVAEAYRKLLMLFKPDEYVLEPAQRVGE